MLSKLQGSVRVGIVWSGQVGSVTLGRASVRNVSLPSVRYLCPILLVRLSLILP